MFGMMPAYGLWTGSCNPLAPGRKFKLAVQSRMEYAVSPNLGTRQDSGRQTFTFLELLGNLTSGAVATAYYSERQRNFPDVIQHRSAVRLRCRFRRAEGILSQATAEVFNNKPK